MKVLVAAHDLDIGGAQLNAIELAAAVRDLGHEVVVTGRRGPLEQVIAELQLRYVPDPGGSQLAFAGARSMRALTRRERFDVVHAYEWAPTVDACFGARLIDNVPVVATVMSMALVSFFPGSVPLVVGTEQIAATARPHRWGQVIVHEPPIDTAANHPEFDGREFRSGIGVGPDQPLVVIVSRLAHELKAEGIERAISAMERLDPRLAATLVVVGDGPARARMDTAADRVNRALGRRAVVLTGEILDPRPAYAAADIVLGMGGSALRAMAFAKPVVVLGEDGFAAILSPESCDQFLWAGFYGLGDGQSDPVELAVMISSLLADPELRRQLGEFGRELVVARFDLRRQGTQLEAVYESAVRARVDRRDAISDVARSAPGVVSYRLGRKLAAMRGRSGVDDMNAKEAIRRFRGEPG